MTVGSGFDSLPASVDDAYISVIKQLVNSGHQTEIGGPGEGSRELLAFTTGMTQPRRRLLANPQRPINIVGAIARLVWMFAGNDRLEDIAFYEPKVRRFTDNNLTVPGSSYGARLFEPRPGTNQMEGVVSRLRKRPASRRASAVIWSPEDAVRSSNDIPCAFGVFYHIRDGVLIATTAMRSNNAFLLLPYNFFEFSMLAELVAASCGVPIGRYVHWTASMHLFERDEKAYREVLGVGGKPGKSIEMPPIPPEPDPLNQANRLAQFEAKVRMAPSELATMKAMDDATRALDDYWISFLSVLLIHKLCAMHRYHEATERADALPDHLRGSAQQYLSWNVPASEDTPPTEQVQLSIVDLPDGNQRGSVLRAAHRKALDLRLLDKRLAEMCDDVFPHVTADEWLGLQAEFRRRATESLAARTVADDPDYVPELEDVRRFIETLRG